MTCAYCGSLLPDGAMFCGDCGRRVAPDGATAPRATVSTAPHSTVPDSTVPDSTVPDLLGAEPAASVPVERPIFIYPAAPKAAERPLPSAPPVAETFTLQFSTGESITITGTGLIGRNPWPEPGETMGQMVRVFDTGRSVSKSHLEFGQSDGKLWVADRYSSNGTILTVPGEQPRRCEPGKRVQVPRGARIDLGEQFFDVS